MAVTLETRTPQRFCRTVPLTSLPTHRVPFPDHQIAGSYRFIRTIFRQSPRMFGHRRLGRDAKCLKASARAHAAGHG